MGIPGVPAGTPFMGDIALVALGGTFVAQVLAAITWRAVRRWRTERGSHDR